MGRTHSHMPEIQRSDHLFTLRFSFSKHLEYTACRGLNNIESLLSGFPSLVEKQTINALSYCMYNSCGKNVYPSLESLRPINMVLSE